MAENLKLHVLQCPNCRHAIETFSPFKASTKCPSCGTVISNPNFITKEADIPSRMIPFTTQESDFEQALVNTLIGQDYVPKDIFQAINTDAVFRAYLPMYLFEGTYQASWSCESSYEDQKVDISRNWTDSGKTISTKTVKKWRPQNGNASGNFAFLCLANEGDKSLPEELRNFTNQFPYDVMLSKEFNGELLTEDDERLVTVSRNADATIVWQKHGKDLVDETAQRAALNQIGDQEIRNFRASSSFNLTTKGDYLLVPFWFVYYNYNNQRYNFMMDGTGQHWSYSYPQDQEMIDFVNGKEKIKKYVKWCWLLTFVLFYFFNFTVAAVYFVLWLIAKIIVNKKINSAIDAAFAEAKEVRRQSASQL